MLLASCAELRSPSQPKVIKHPRLNLTAISFGQLLGWQQDNHAEAFKVFLRSCKALKKKQVDQKAIQSSLVFRIKNWSQICEKATHLGQKISPTLAREFFERQFNFYQVSDKGNKRGLFTGYYEPQLHGSRNKSEQYKVALYRRPADLISVKLGQFNKNWKGREINGKLEGNRLVPYVGRAAIERGALNGRGLELLWVDNVIDAFFLHIQGSGRIVLDTGEIIRVGFAGRNGQPYYAIGRELVKTGEIAKGNISLQTIRLWLEKNPDKAVDLMNKNKSYVFFRETVKIDPAGPNHIDGPAGASGVFLTPGRSLAVDRKYFSMGTPMWIETTFPRTNEPMRRMVIAQDTGGAITGPVRGDLFWGAGTIALDIAGHMKQPGMLYILLPKPDA